MSEEFEQAHEHLEHAAHGHEGKGHTRPAIIIAIMAAALALMEFAAKDAQTNYLTNHIAATNTWAQYEAKTVRRTVLTSEADLLESLSTKTDPVTAKRTVRTQGMEYIGFWRLCSRNRRARRALGSSANACALS
jgi:hypothetical protein